MVVSSDAEERPRWPQAFVVVDPGGAGEREVGVHDLLVIGRECGGVDASQQLILDDQTISRRHVEIRLEPERDKAWVFDTSTNGTRLNGARIDHATPVPIRPGDRLTVGAVVIEFRSERFAGLETGGAAPGPRETVRSVSLSLMALAVGDVIGYTAIAQYTDEPVLLRGIDQLYRDLRGLLSAHGGSLAQYAGDAFFAMWEGDAEAEAADRALRFSLAAVELVREVAPGLPLRTPDDEPVRMAWGVEYGQGAVSAVTGAHVAVMGDATNIAFQLSAVAGRDGRPPVVTSGRVEALMRDRFRFGEPEDLRVRGRLGAQRIHGVLGSR